jgi:hypothetical protein
MGSAKVVGRREINQCNGGGCLLNPTTPTVTRPIVYQNVPNTIPEKMAKRKQAGIRLGRNPGTQTEDAAQCSNAHGYVDATTKEIAAKTHHWSSNTYTSIQKSAGDGSLL